MKRIFSLVALVMLSIAGLSAQNNTPYALIGVHNSANGELSITDPSTTLQIQLTLVKEQTIVGPYAKYAQKYLDIRPALVERTSYSVQDAHISVVESLSTPAPEAINTTTSDSYLGSATEFARISPERTSTSIVSIDEAAQQAAQAIFSIRRHRMELITGEAGENVFGAGLKDALAELDKKEQEYMELFLGKKIRTTTTHTYVIPMAVDVNEYAIARIKSQSGLQPASAQDGDVVKLVLTPSATEPKLNYVQEVAANNKLGVAVRLANQATCTIMVGNKTVNSAVLPIFELGRTTYILPPAAKK